MINKRILLITYQYYPLVTPRAFRWHTIAKEFSKKGFDVDIVCCAFHNLPKYEIIDTIHIHRIKPWFFKTLYRKNVANLSKVDSEFDVESKEKKPKGLHSFVDFTISIFSRIYHIFWWPDFGMFWIPPAIKACRNLIQKVSYDRVLATSWPVCAHVVAYYLKNDLQRSATPLIIDVGDPFALNEFTSSNNTNLYGSINFSFEKNLFSKATGLSVTNQAIKDLYIEKFFLPDNKIKVIPPLFENFSNQGMPEFKFLGNRKNKKLLYIGSFRRGNRSPLILLKLFSGILNHQNQINVELHLMGDHHEFESEIKNYINQCPENIFSYGLVSRQSALSASAYADFLINIGNMSPYQLPSKLIDYISTGKPIINIQQIDSDSSFEILKDYPLLTNLDFHHQDFETNLNEFIHLLKSTPERLPQSKINEMLVEFNEQKISNAYLTDWWNSSEI